MMRMEAGVECGAILDVDGTLLDSMSIWDRAGELYLRAKGKDAEPQLADILYSMSMEEGALYMKKTYELEADVSEIVLGISEIIADFYRNEAVLKPGAGRLLKMLQERRIRMVIATTGDKELVETAFARLGILEFFEKIFTCTEIGAGKSSPDIYLEAAAYLKMEPKQILVFEDALHAVQTAKKAGFQVVGIYDESSRKYKQEIQRISDIFLQEADSFEMFLKNISAEAEQQKDAERK